MTDATLVDLIMGPLGALVVLCILVALLVRGQLLVPAYVNAGNTKRNELLEKENAEQNNEIIRLEREKAALEVRVATLETKLEYLEEQIKDLRRGA